MSQRLDRAATGFVAAVVEAWQELRIHKLRVLLSLVGVMIAVASLTAAMAAAAIAKQVVTEQYEHDGRPALLGVWAHPMGEGVPPLPEVVRPAFFTAAEKLDIRYASMTSSMGIVTSHAGLERQAEIRIVDPAYATLHRVVPSRGRWLEEADAQNMSPAVVVGERLLRKLGLAGADLPVTIELGGTIPVTATVVGATPKGFSGSTVFMLADAYQHWFGADQPLMDAQYELWVPPKRARQLSAEARRVIAAELPGYQVDVSRMDYLAYGDEDPLREVAIVVSVIGGVILLLGALSLLNVALVTIQQRVREVGIRRSFGATTGRVFFSVLMESVVATVVAGAVGVMLAVALISNPWVAKRLIDHVDDVPAFPFEAALLGLAVSVGVGALTGVIPALVAARVKIVDAIRF
ncbi:MAG: ABC transporter permease [Nocardioidaceae bacterium]|nr:ABC transporter permease [Nocardioidaceae bacterium]